MGERALCSWMKSELCFASMKRSLSRGFIMPVAWATAMEVVWWSPLTMMVRNLPLQDRAGAQQGLGLLNLGRIDV